MDFRTEEQLRLHLFGSVHDAFETCARIQLQMREDLCRSIDLFLAQANGVPVCSTPARKIAQCPPLDCPSEATAAFQLIAVQERCCDGLPLAALQADSCVPEERSPMCWDMETMPVCVTNSKDQALAEAVFDQSGPPSIPLVDEAAFPRTDRSCLPCVGEAPFVASTCTTVTCKVEDQELSSNGKGEKKSEDSPSKRMCSRVGLEVAKRMPAEETEHKPLWKMSAMELLESAKFDNCIGALILMNAITLGIQADYAAQYRTDDFPQVFQIIERIFAFFFTSELALRLYAMRLSFFFTRRLSVLVWNYFDLLIVFAQLLEEAIALLSSSIGINTKNLRVLRVLRILRLVRVLRVVRVLRLISELRTIVSSILGSFKSLFWTMVLLLLMIYIVGVYFTQSVTNHMVEQIEEEPDGIHILSKNEQALDYYFGSLARTLLTLWEAIAGGEDWDKMAMPLGEVQSFVAVIFVCYIAFALLALMNVVTGFFVHTALLRAKKEEEVFIADQIVNLFNVAGDARSDQDSRLTEADILAVLSDVDNAAEWKAIDIVPAEAQYIFRLLDVDNLGWIDFEEFMSGCLRIKGPAQSMDLLTVMQEHRMFAKKFGVFETKMLDQFDEVKKRLDQQGGLRLS
eukprot:TRINITY_DN15075_c0_g2_i1.p1 TRINITY_DN15075_c0_g2~~TRINITY_DN15075_c0_g2_i1.p1  ORF type:complete len:628 (-),score=123.42 TRINITY_DN15075_c0_g2_i1:647-2530(-)